MPDTCCTDRVRYTVRSGPSYWAPPESGSLKGRYRPTMSPAVVILLLSLVLGSVPARAEVGDVNVIASPNVDSAALSSADLAAIFLGRRSQWSDGTRIRIAILKSEEVQEAFLEAAVDRSPRQYWAHWRNIVFSGRGTMPKIFSSEEKLLQYMTDQEGVIGLTTDIESAQAHGAVVLTIGGVNES